MPKRTQKVEKDGIYVLKLVLFFLMGAFWLRIAKEDGSYLSLPIGLVFGVVFASHDHFQVDRKIEYAVLLIATALSAYIPIVGFWV
ncbi:MAG TPA: hypothetical protein VGA08_00960 [Candidatus Saccharimonadales bacterium]